MSPLDILARAEAEVRRHDLPAPEGHVTWRIWGEGPPLALFHGAFGSWRHWIRTLPLARRFTLLVPDMPGFGSSTAPGEVSPETSARLLADGLRTFVSEGTPLRIAGFSFGARAATRIAADWHNSVARLTLVAPGGTPFPRAPLPRLVRGLARLPDRERRVAHRHNLEAVMFGNPDAIDGLALAVQDANTRESRYRPSYADAPLEAMIADLDAPVACLWGSRDTFAAGRVLERASWIRRVARNGHAQILRGAGHWLAYERAEAVNAALSL